MNKRLLLLGRWCCIPLAVCVAATVCYRSGPLPVFNGIVRARQPLDSYLEGRGPATRVVSASEASRIARQFGMDMSSVQALCGKYPTILFVPYDASTTCLLFFDGEKRAVAYVLGSQ